MLGAIDTDDYKRLILLEAEVNKENEKKKKEMVNASASYIKLGLPTVFALLSVFALPIAVAYVYCIKEIIEVWQSISIH